MTDFSIKSSRHIRHDWQTFNDSHEQNTVRALCGVRTSVENAGIPGVTDQPSVVTKKDREYWGWCSMCVRIVWGRSAADLSRAGDGIEQLYTLLRTSLFSQMVSIVKKSNKANGRPTDNAYIYEQLSHWPD